MQIIEGLLKECGFKDTYASKVSEMVGDRPGLSALKKMPTINQGHTDNLKFDDGKRRIWLSRMTVADGMPYNNQVTIEDLIDGVWTTVEEYNPAKVRESKVNEEVQNYEIDAEDIYDAVMNDRELHDKLYSMYPSMKKRISGGNFDAGLASRVTLPLAKAGADVWYKQMKEWADDGSTVSVPSGDKIKAAAVDLAKQFERWFQEDKDNGVKEGFGGSFDFSRNSKVDSFAEGEPVKVIADGREGEVVKFFNNIAGVYVWVTFNGDKSHGEVFGQNELEHVGGNK